ncbi:hypothetical protein NCAS_0A10840 [Naumovozyma castellii]|uniref:DUF2423 domain-containing protein n=1 Tax=Naumovozyma castellii TaxID=27288 RepID=G0V844_NAUCA|nr:hypothetical protein NCAS_0A10840 [Naumovozyma castellii CBS 4309]CCC67642.1 hypothetical protein NCAS_0A10840 [Naumovozyma castellii CBS 4309]
MAKSLRAKSHLKAKSVKRHAVFQKIVDAREERIANKLKQGLIDQKMAKLKEQNGGDADAVMEIDAEGKTDEEKKSTETKKVSTSGWRDARHHNYKKNKSMKKKKGSFTRF